MLSKGIARRYIRAVETVRDVLTLQFHLSDSIALQEMLSAALQEMLSTARESWV